MSQELSLAHLDELTEEYLEPEMLLDPYHPNNDGFYQGLNEIRRSVVHAESKLKPKHREVVKFHRSGLTAPQIAEKVKLTPATIYRVLKTPEASRLDRLLTHLQQAMDGPNKQHRTHILTRIALDNEKNRPNTSISAIQEINKMEGAYESTANGNVFNISINNDLLPKGELDRLPQTYDSTVHLEKQ